VPVAKLEEQLLALYDGLQAPAEALEAIKLEIEAIAYEREGVVKKELTGLKRVLDTLEAKEMKLVDEMVSGRVSRDHYDKLSARYATERHAAEARRAQLDVDYREPLDFLDKCLVVSGTFRYIHEHCEEKQKLLVRALFERIVVHDRAIVAVALNPPFSFFLGDQLRRMFKDPLSAGARRDIFEQLVTYTLSPDYDEMKRVISAITAGTTESERAA